jgi:CheY-like chemotaxis protein
MAPEVRPVLIVDDDVAVRRTIGRFLGFEGFTVIEADNGLNALTYLRGGGDAGVIVLDLRMPVMDGWTFRREQRADPALADIPIVILSGVEPDRVSELDAAATFEKPFSMPQLVATVRRFCEVPPSAA